MIDERSYGPLARALHHVAFNPSFGGITVQRRLAEIEESLYSDDLDASRYVDRPVFVAGLPRAGTTLILNLLSQVPEFATHTYRDMPFVMAPLLWNRLSAPFQQASDNRERAHGDGVAVGFDSPEAFEEVIWKAFWPDKYQSTHIEPWNVSDRQPDFENFLRRHAEKLVAARARSARRAGRTPPCRYLSKNNANISRLDLLPKIFPDCRIVIPIRSPEAQIRSLLRQHERFTELHARDSFARNYMSWIGHHEFGGDLRPIRFEHGPVPVTNGTSKRKAFWTDIWMHAHREILKPSPHKILVDFTTLCLDPWHSLSALADALEFDDKSVLTDRANQVKANASDTAEHPPTCDAEALYQEARSYCVNPPDHRAYASGAAE